MIQQTVQSDPFFTNDVVGLIKVLVTVVIPTTTAIVASVWKFMRGDLQAADARLQETAQRADAEIRRNLDGLGTRISAIESRQTEIEGSIRAEIAQVRERLAMMEKVAMLVERGAFRQRART
jgi:hypothetical protein